jgi:transglutaminase-like putative cysteine protease
MSLDPAGFLGDCDVIDFRCREVMSLASQLVGETEVATARLCFEFVRDQIRHSSDFRLNPVTCRASDVLQHRTGYCYAKSHLLCALLRANQIPAGLCYQRLTIGADTDGYCLHGLNAIYLRDFGWYRADARGNRKDVDAQFDPPQERLAFAIDSPGEADLPGVYAEPLPVVVDCLQTCKTWEQVSENLPDWQSG